MAKTDPIRPTDDEARALARRLIAGARFAALGVLTPEGAPQVTRIAFGTAPDGGGLTLVSDLAAHTKALRADPRASLLLGEPGPRGDPLTHPRLTLQALAGFVPRDGDDHAALTELWLAAHPKARLYAGFADFRFVRFTPVSAFLNGGFGRAFRLSAADLAPEATGPRRAG